MTTEVKPSSRPYILIALVWLALACAIGATGRMAQLRPPLPQVVILALTAALIWAGVKHRGFHDWLEQVSLRGVVAFHLTRFVGFAFLATYARNELPFEFAVPAGWGDIIVAVGALAIVLFQPRPESRPPVLMLWNVVGFADIVGAVLSAARLALRDASSMAPLLEFPMSLVPTFIVPIVVASHVLVFWRISRPATALPVTQGA